MIASATVGVNWASSSVESREIEIEMNINEVQ